MSEAAKRRAALEIAAGTRHPALGMKHTDSFKRMVSKMFRGKRLSTEHRRKIGEANKRNGNDRFLTKLQKGQAPHWAFKWGAENHFWRGGITPEDWTARVSPQYQEWREAVLLRDENRCQDCGKVSTKNHAHHLRSFREFPDLRFVVWNGVTVCGSCHRRREMSIGRCANGVNSGNVPTGIIPSQA